MHCGSIPTKYFIGVETTKDLPRKISTVTVNTFNNAALLVNKV